MATICDDCPSPNACRLGVSCEDSRSLVTHFANNKPRTTRKGTNAMSNSPKITVTPADVAKKAEDEKLTTEVPAQSTGEQTDTKATKEKAKEVVEETAEAAKKTAKDRITGLLSAAKKNKKFFYGVVTGAVSTAVVLAIAAKEKVEEVVAELEIADDADPETEGDTTDETSV